MNRFVDNIYRFSSCYRLCSINIIRLLNMHNISSQMAHMGLNNVLQVKLITHWNVTNPICWQIHPYDTIKNDLSRQNLGIVEIGISFGLLKGAAHLQRLIWCDWQKSKDWIIWVGDEYLLTAGGIQQENVTQKYAYACKCHHREEGCKKLDWIIAPSQAVVS